MHLYQQRQYFGPGGDTTDLSSLAEAINKESGKTGISAVSKGSYVELVSDRGDAIKIENFSISGAANCKRPYSFDGSTAVGAAATLNSGATNDGRVDGQVIFRSAGRVPDYRDGCWILATSAGASSFSLLESVKTLISALRQVLRMLWVSSMARYPISTVSELN